MAALTVRGTVYHCKDLRLASGTVRDKFMVLLNTPIDNDDFLFTLATSNADGMPTTPGCGRHRTYREGVYFLPVGQCQFRKNTWVQLHDLLPWPRHAVESDQRLSITDLLPPNIATLIVVCLLAHHSADIMPRHLALLTRTYTPAELAAFMNSRRMH